ncbi:MAG: leucine-rich repeat domain-containing protein [Bacteroidetes bacterium]|nr:leucine-rich repeat domain-containing protein [Bacteroidota bacterium]
MKKLIFNLFLALLFAPAIHAQSDLLDSLTLDTMAAFTSLDEALKQPDNVVKLVLRKEKLDSFPEAVYQFKNLQYLDLSRNNIREIPDSISRLKKLQVLHLSRNNIEYIPRTIGDLSELRILNINQNELYVIPPQIGRLKKLEVLDLWSNNISVFPDELKDISGNLKVLDLRTILINRETQERIKAMLPNTKVYFSPPCKCNG